MPGSRSRFDASIAICESRLELTKHREAPGEITTSHSVRRRELALVALHGHGLEVLSSFLEEPNRQTILREVKVVYRERVGGEDAKFRVGCCDAQGLFCIRDGLAIPCPRPGVNAESSACTSGATFVVYLTGEQLGLLV